MNSMISRVEILIQQQKYTEAEKLLKDILTNNPTDAHVLLLMAEVNLQQDKFDQALTFIKNAIGVSPDEGILFYVKARVHIQKNEYDQAEKDLQQALQLDPAHPDFYAFLASIKLTRKQYEEALELANKALELDAENILGLNTRSAALLKLNRKEESFKTIEGALREDPNNAYTHANYGWGLLEKGDHKKALEHFREALKQDPNFQYAQAGMAEALKASNLFYRLFLKYAFWIGNLTEKYQWGVIIGFYLGVKVLRTIAANNETLQPYLTPLIIALGIIAFSTWVISPISNLFLRLNPYGKFLLKKKEMMSSNFVGISLLLFLAGAISYLVLGDEKYLSVTAFGFAMMLPFGSMFSPSKYKHSLIIFTTVMTLLGIVAIYTTFTTGELFNLFSTIFIFSFVAFQWIANFLIIRQSNV